MRKNSLDLGFLICKMEGILLVRHKAALVITGKMLFDLLSDT